MKHIECPPDAKRAILGFRDTGYTLYTAVADIVDNSINAKADRVWITFAKSPDGSLHARIIDDGYGMDEKELLDAMRYGTPERDDNVLGRFGLGLKTGSTAICRRLTVASRKAKTGKIHAATWDLDLVAQEDEWLLEIGEAEGNVLDEYTELLEDSASGTVVFWDKIDRLGTHTHEAMDEGEEITKSTLSAYMRRLREHLEMVFHRMMEKGLEIWLNGDKLEPWNPFCPEENTEHVLKRSFNVQLPHSKEKHTVTLNAYVIPNKYEYSTADAKARARLANRWQGFYVFREDRVIIAADWLGMYSQEPHMTLLRAELTFPRALDHMFSLDIKKSTLELNRGLYEIVNKEIEPARREAERRYRQGRNKALRDKGSPHAASQKLLDSKYAETTENLKVEQVGDNKVKIRNADGVTVVSMPTLKKPGIKDLIQVVDSLEDGLFWEPALINGRLGVRLNRSHKYYERVYLPNFNDSVTVRGIDSVVWALAKCEQEVMHDEIRKRLADLRYHVSRTLRELAEELPEVDLDDIPNETTGS